MQPMEFWKRLQKTGLEPLQQGECRQAAQHVSGEEFQSEESYLKLQHRLRFPQGP